MLIYETWHNVRRIYTDGRRPGPDTIGTRMGHCVGHWEREDLPLTETALTACADHDPLVDDPLLNCERPGMLRDSWRGPLRLPLQFDAQPLPYYFQGRLHARKAFAQCCFHARNSFAQRNFHARNSFAQRRFHLRDSFGQLGYPLAQFGHFSPQHGNVMPQPSKEAEQ